MRPRTKKPVPPASTDELLILLRQTRLLEDDQLRRLAEGWNGEDNPAPHVAELVTANLLTRYQGEQLLAGRIGKLRLGPYLLLDRLGQGGMGQVYKAEHLLLRRTVALKVLGRVRSRGASKPVEVREDTVKGPQTPRVHSRRRTQLRREVETTGRLSHANIVAAHDACRLRGRLVLVLEYIEGVDLDRFVRETGPLPVPLAVEVIRQVAVALGYLHQRGLVHRDVKPANLILTHATKPEDPPRVKLLDLGLVCPVEQAGEELCGTPDYIAPERGLSAQSTDIRSDLYSLGCTFYQLLTGRVPYPGGNWTGKLLRHRIELPTPIGDLRPEVPAEVVQVVERLMARDPEERLATPDEVIEALTPRLVEPVYPAAIPISEKTALPTPRRRRPMLIWLALTAILFGAGAGTIASQSFQATEEVNGVAERSEGKKGTGRAETKASQDLHQALRAARDGAVIELANGRHILPPIRLRGKRLTLRAAPGAKPVLTRQNEKGWDAILDSDCDLTLEGLELIGGETEGLPSPLVSVESGNLTVRDCRITQRGPAPALTLRQGSQLHLVKSRVQALTQGLALQALAEGACQIRLQDSECNVRDVTGAALLLWSSEADTPRSVHLEVSGSKLRAGRIVACRSLGTPLHFRAGDNQFIFFQGLVSFDGYADPDSWRGQLRWEGRDNRYETTGPWVRLEGRPGPAWDEQAFGQLWRGQP